MEIIVLVGIPASGKSTLALNNFPHHKRINLDVLHSRKKEDDELADSFRNDQDTIIDNTNTTIKSRRKYLDLARLHNVKIRAIYLKIPIYLALQRNALRVGKERIPDNVLRFYHKILRPPTVKEGFDSVEELEIS
ncbi:MAG: AAA family ATPase [Thaumarchaeota archaeon]|nr:AAA family ATPase [Nitrososphaerota archaeon]